MNNSEFFHGRESGVRCALRLVEEAESLEDALLRLRRTLEIVTDQAVEEEGRAHPDDPMGPPVSRKCPGCGIETDKAGPCEDCKAEGRGA